MSFDSPETNRTELKADNETVDETRDQTKRSSEFSSENHKLEISNLPFNPKYYLVKQLLERHFKLKPHKIKVGNSKAYVAFASQKERDDALAAIDNQDWKGRTLSAKPASARHDPLVKKQQHQETQSAQPNDDSQPPDENINSKVCPLVDKSYDEQLKIKEASMRNVLNMAKQISKLSPNLPPKLAEWVANNRKICCQFDGVVPSPVLVGYRNKCEFNIDRTGTIGFRLGRYRDGSERVVTPSQDCPIINRLMLQILEKLQSYFKNTGCTKLRGFDHVTHEGHLRQVTMRINQQGECLVIIDIHQQDLIEEDLEKETESLVDLLKTFKEVVSIYFNISEKSNLKDADKTLKLVYGQEFLYEHLEISPEVPLQFRIGPNSFFQVNTKAAELLYRSILEIAQLNSSSLVLDVGCGTGTIALSLAKHVSHVIGIEVVESAIEDAKMNAKENEIQNVSFFAGKAEELISETITILKNKLPDHNGEGDIVAIVDPPRTGFNSSFIKSIRASQIMKIIYVACDPHANTNLISLCRPPSKAYQGEPFVPTKAKAFDLFPHTKFCELVLLYERLK